MTEPKDATLHKRIGAEIPERILSGRRATAFPSSTS
jgi:hypothetical protein